MKLHPIRQLAARAAVVIFSMLAVVCSGFWIRGAFCADVASLAVPPRTAIHLAGGRCLTIVWLRQKDPVVVPIEKYAFRAGTNEIAPERVDLWPPVRWSTGSSHIDASLATQCNLAIDWWMLVLCFAFYPVGRGAIFFVGRVKHRGRRRKGLCTRCGYDVRA